MQNRKSILGNLLYRLPCLRVLFTIFILAVGVSCNKKATTVIQEEIKAPLQDGQRETTQTTNIEGQVFLVMRGGENIKLGLTQIWTFSDLEIQKLATSALTLNGTLVQRMALEKARKRIKELNEQAQRNLTSDRLAKCIESIQKEQSLIEGALAEKRSTSETAITALNRIESGYNPLNDSLSNRDMAEQVLRILISLSAGRESDAQSDADGKFKLKVTTQRWIVAYGARVQDTLAPKVEKYFWIVPISNPEKQLILSNNNSDPQEALQIVHKVAAEGSRENELQIESIRKSSDSAINAIEVAYDELFKSETTEKEKSEIARQEKERNQLAVGMAKARELVKLNLAEIKRAAGTSGKNTLGIPFRWCPAGELDIGKEPLSTDRSQATQGEAKVIEGIQTKGYWIAEHEVTHGEWKAVTGEEYREGYKDYPKSVSWLAATSFCKLLTLREKAANKLPAGYEYRLPTELEWERAAQAGCDLRYVEDSILKKYGCFNDYYPSKGKEYDRVQRVSTKAPNAWGIYDMYGNVWEWCANYYASPFGQAASPLEDYHDRVLRGGGYDSSGGWICINERTRASADQSREDSYGFRPVLGFVQSTQ